VVLHHLARVAEDLRPQVDVGGAADLLQQARVVALGGSLRVNVQPFGQAHRDERAAQSVLEVESDAEIGRQRQRGDHFRRGDPLIAG